MRSVRKVISLFLVFMIFLCCAAVVSAEEAQIDWSNVDLENFNYRELEDSQWLSLRDWLQKSEDLHTVFYVTTTKGDGWVGDLWSNLLYSLFMEDPVRFIQSLALEDETTQSRTISKIIYVAVVYKGEFEKLMRGLVLPDTATDSDRNVLMKIISHAEEKGNMNITNPKTGDSIGIAPLLLVASGLGIAVLLKRRKLLV